MQLTLQCWDQEYLHMTDISKYKCVIEMKVSGTTKILRNLLLLLWVKCLILEHVN